MLAVTFTDPYTVMAGVGLIAFYAFAGLFLLGQRVRRRRRGPR